MQTRTTPLRRNRLANLLLEASPAAVVVTDSQNHIVAMNRLAEESFGYQEHELVGRSIKKVFPECGTGRSPSSDDASHHECILSQLRDPDPTEPLFFQACRKDGQTFSTKVTVHPLATDSCLVNVIDLTQRIIHDQASNHEKQIQGERLAAVLQMVSGLAHESRNALQRAQSCLDLLQLDLVDQSEMMTLTEQIRGALTDIQQNYEEVKDYAAPIVLKRQAVDLPELCRRIYDELTQSLGDDAPRLSLRCTTACQNVRLDAGRIGDVLRHVLENAIHASPNQSEIEFHCDYPDAPTIEIRVRDHGEGLSREVEQRMFEPFFTTKQQGTGLGLAVCRRIIEAHEGTIEAANAPEGGTVVRIRIPVGDPTG
ncbi:Sensor protein FixL [Stieleria bergensis]|uniref:histidine kinase n=1 Tax=Stieleria bergensis TaxID=2528025 RepID=A0A517SZ63_9BACT|nr:Sensor protein FixL [Planctomycetes bacterium SV_7m_r]